MPTFSTNPIGFWMVVIGGLALFLFGISNISKVMKALASTKLRSIIDKCSKNKFIAALTGCGLTALIQSSGATTALTIGFVRAGMMTLLEAAAIIIGANIGTCITGFIVAIPFMQYFPLILAFGSIILLFATRTKWINLGNLFFSLGCIFFGIWILESNLKTLANENWFIEIFKNLANMPWLGFIGGFIATSIIQSSSAVVGIVQGLYAAAVIGAVETGATISLFGFLPIVIGSEIGKTMIGLICSLGGSKESKRVAWFHVLFNIIGSIIFMTLIFSCKGWIDSFDTTKMDPKLQIALFHLMFNVVTGILIFILMKPLCSLLEKIFKDKGPKKPALVIKELDKGVLKQFPRQGLLLAKDQVITMFEFSKLMFESINQYLLYNQADDANYAKDIEASIDKIDRQLNTYLLQGSDVKLESNDILLLSRTLKACKDIERIGDYGENLVDFYIEGNERKEKIPATMLERFLSANKNAVDIITKTIDAFKNNDLSISLDVISLRRTFNKNLDTLINARFDEIVSTTGTEHNATYYELVYVDILNCYERVYSHCSNIAKLFGTDKTYSYNSDEEHLQQLSSRY